MRHHTELCRRSSLHSGAARRAWWEAPGAQITLLISRHCDGNPTCKLPPQEYKRRATALLGGVMQVPPSPEQAVPAAHGLPALGWLAQHWEAAVMHVLPHGTWPEGQAAHRGRRGRGQRHQLGNAQPEVTATVAHLRYHDDLPCCTRPGCYTGHAPALNLPQAAPSEGQESGAVHLSPTLVSDLQHCEAVMQLLPHFTLPVGHPVRKYRSSSSWSVGK